MAPKFKSVGRSHPMPGVNIILKLNAFLNSSNSLSKGLGLRLARNLNLKTQNTNHQRTNPSIKAGLRSFMNAGVETKVYLSVPNLGTLRQVLKTVHYVREARNGRTNTHTHTHTHRHNNENERVMSGCVACTGKTN